MKLERELDAVRKQMTSNESPEKKRRSSFGGPSKNWQADNNNKTTQLKPLGRSSSKNEDVIAATNARARADPTKLSFKEKLHFWYVILTKI
jgi:hypothetical protein